MVLKCLVESKSIPAPLPAVTTPGALAGREAHLFVAELPQIKDGTGAVLSGRYHAAVPPFSYCRTALRAAHSEEAERITVTCFQRVVAHIVGELDVTAAAPASKLAIRLCCAVHAGLWMMIRAKQTAIPTVF